MNLYLSVGLPFLQEARILIENSAESNQWLYFNFIKSYFEVLAQLAIIHQKNFEIGPLYQSRSLLMEILNKTARTNLFGVQMSVFSKSLVVANFP